MWGRTQFVAILVAALFCLSDSAPVKKPPTRLKKPPTTIQKFDPFVGVKDSGKVLFNAFSNNAIANVFKNTYSFFYWLPRRNIPFDTPWKLFGERYRKSLQYFLECMSQLLNHESLCSLGNSSSEWIAWYQLPHNLPPYIYLSEGQEPKDFFCWGLPGINHQISMPLRNVRHGCKTILSIFILNSTTLRKKKETLFLWEIGILCFCKTHPPLCFANTENLS